MNRWCLMFKIIKIQKLHSCDCAKRLEDILKSVDGVNSVSVSFEKQSIAIDYNNSDVLTLCKEKINGFEDVRVVEKTSTIIYKIDNLNDNSKLRLEAELTSISGIVGLNISVNNQMIALGYTKRDALEEAKNKIELVLGVKVASIVKSIGFKIKNLDCPNCAKALENKLNNIGGILNAVVSFEKQVITLFYEDSIVLDSAKAIINNFELVKIIGAINTNSLLLPLKKKEESIITSKKGKNKLSFRIKGLDCAGCAS